MQTAVGLKEQLNQAIVAHGQWKVRLAGAISMGSSEFSVDNVRRDDRCQFGTWLYGLAAPYRAGSHFEEVRQLHATFHREAAEVLALAVAGRSSEAQSAMGLSGAFGRASTKLTLAISAWQRAAE